MAIVSVDCLPESLGHQTTFQAIIPEHRSEQTRVLYLLHGLFGNDKQWIQSSSIALLAEGRDLAIIMPDTHRGYYTDMKFGAKYGTYLAEELPEIVAAIFALRPDRSQTFIGGLSMGGYGALKYGLSAPYRYAKVFALSPAVDIARMRHESLERDQEFNLIFGTDSEFEGSASDLFHLLDTADEAVMKNTAFLQICGRDDFLYQDNLKFKQQFEHHSYPYTFKERAGGHTWDLWNEEIVTSLNWLDHKDLLFHEK